MKALITGASSGIGMNMAKELEKYGYDLILVSRREEKMQKLADSLKCNCEIIKCDLSDSNNCFNLFEKVKDKDISVLINCAGFGVFGNFSDTDIYDEINMINTNITSLHILTKLFLKKFISQDSGFILNVSSAASFAPGPMFSSYYASKAYVLRLSEALWEELSGKKNVHISVLCPGPVDTEFNSVAKVRFTVGSLSAEYVAEYTVRKMFAKKRIIVPGLKMKLARIGSKISPSRLSAKMTMKFQKKKNGDNR